jgi:hypothetical protein
MYSYNNNVNVVFPTNYQLRSFYNSYNDGFTDPDDGYNSEPINMSGVFYMNGTYYNQFYINTNGCMYFRSPSANWGSNPIADFVINGNAGDLYIEPGRVLDDGSRSGLYYKETQHSTGGYSMEVVVNCNFYGEDTMPASYLINLYRDTEHQYVVIMSKSNPTSSLYGDPSFHAGPWNVTNVSQTNSTQSQVWKSDLEGQNWEYLGNGSLSYNITVQKTCGNQGCGTRVGKVCLIGASTCTCAQYKYFYPRCSRIQQSLGICNGRAGAWVPAITVCSQRLF